VIGLGGRHPVDRDTLRSLVTLTTTDFVIFRPIFRNCLAADPNALRIDLQFPPMPGLFASANYLLVRAGPVGRAVSCGNDIKKMPRRRGAKVGRFGYTSTTKNELHISNREV
jgi:hypothetical protein